MTGIFQVHDYPAFKDSFEKARAELEAAADSPNKSRPSGAQAVQSRKVPNLLTSGSPLLLSHGSRIKQPNLHPIGLAGKGWKSFFLIPHQQWRRGLGLMTEVLQRSDKHFMPAMNTVTRSPLSMEGPCMLEPLASTHSSKRLRREATRQRLGATR